LGEKDHGEEKKTRIKENHDVNDHSVRRKGGSPRAIKKKRTS